MDSESKTSQAVPKYKLRGSGVLNRQEIDLHDTLHEIFDGKNEVLAKLSLAELVAIPGRDKRYLHHWRRVQRRTLDFLVCTRRTFIPILAIKLETEAEGKKRRANGRDVIDSVLEDIGVPLLRLRRRDKHEAKDLAKQISFILEETMDSRPVPQSSSAGRFWNVAKQKCGLGG